MLSDCEGNSEGEPFIEGVFSSAGRAAAWVTETYSAEMMRKEIVPDVGTINGVMHVEPHSWIDLAHGGARICVAKYDLDPPVRVRQAS